MNTNTPYNYAKAIQHCKALIAESYEARAIRETRAKKREWVVVLSKGGDLHLVVKSLHVPYCDRKRVICTVDEFLADGGEYAASLSCEEAADALRDYIAGLDAELNA